MIVAGINIIPVLQDKSSRQAKRIEEKRKTSMRSISSLSLSLSPSLFLFLLPFSSVEERALEALGAVDEGHHEDVG